MNISRRHLAGPLPVLGLITAGILGVRPAFALSADEQAVAKAIFSESNKPASNSLSDTSARYHFTVKPCQTLGTGESLNEYSTSARIGT